MFSKSKISPVFLIVNGGPVDEKGFAQFLADKGIYNSETRVQENFSQLCDDLREYLKSKNFDKALAAIELTLHLNRNKKRQDGSPSALHEVTQMIWHIVCAEDGMLEGGGVDLETLLVLSAFHDLIEDGLKKFDIPITKHYLKEYFSKLKDTEVTEELWETLLDVDLISKKSFKNNNANKHENPMHIINRF